MPRPLVLGNGRLLVQIDSRGRVRDFFWPQVGIRNHVAGHFHHTGVFEAGRFSWLESAEWEISQELLPQSGGAKTVFSSTAWGLAIEVWEEVRGDSFFRRFSLVNQRNAARQVEVFFSQDFRIAESEIGDTAMYVPRLDAMVHFKWDYYFSCSGRSASRGIHQKTVGLRGINGLQGTWRDAEDGQLLGKPIEQGAVDSTFSVLVELPPQGKGPVTYRIECGRSLSELGRKEDGGRLVLSSVPGLGMLPEALRNFADRSLAVLKTQIDARGAILAANDSDIMQSNRANYSYVWPRDGALVARVLDRAGEHELARRYHEFTIPLITEGQPFFLQKYNTDGTLGATWHPWIFDGVPETPLQEDETALTLWSVWEHVKASGGREWLAGHYEGFVRPMARFLASFIDALGGLPKPSYDLWEERRGVHAFTVATVVAGLSAAAGMAALQGDSEGKSFAGAADQVRGALLKHLVDSESGAFIRTVRQTGSGFEPDLGADASLLLVGRFAGLPADHPAVLATVAKVKDRLFVRSALGGLARYEGDYYGRVSESYPGNPWVITTLWLAQEEIAAATSVRELEWSLRWLEWTRARGGATGVLGEQFHPETGHVMTVSPLTWSHAEYLNTCLDWAERYRELTR